MTPTDLRDWRVRHGLSQAALAALLGIRRMTIVRYEMTGKWALPIPPYLWLALWAIDHGAVEEAAKATPALAWDYSGFGPNSPPAQKA